MCKYCAPYRVSDLKNSFIEMHSQIFLFKAAQYLVKWLAYNWVDSTREPENHLSADLVQNYLNPPVCDARLQYAAQALESAFQQWLKLRCTKVNIDFELDILRHFLFQTDESFVIQSYNEISDKLPVCENWFYRLTSAGRGLKVALPIRLYG